MPALEMVLYRLSTLIAALPLLQRTTAVLTATRRDHGEADHALRLAAASALVLVLEALLPDLAALRRPPVAPLYAILRLVAALLLGRCATPDRLARLQALCYTAAKRSKKVVRAMAAPMSDDEHQQVDHHDTVQGTSKVIAATGFRRQRRVSSGAPTISVVASSSTGSVPSLKPGSSRGDTASDDKNGNRQNAGSTLSNHRMKLMVSPRKQQQHDFSDNLNGSSDNLHGSKNTGVRFAEAVSFASPIGENDHQSQSDSDEELSVSIESTTTTMSEMDCNPMPLASQTEAVENELVAGTMVPVEHPSRSTSPVINTNQEIVDPCPTSPATPESRCTVPDSPMSDINVTSRHVPTSQLHCMDISTRTADGDYKCRDVVDPLAWKCNLVNNQSVRPMSPGPRIEADRTCMSAITACSSGSTTSTSSAIDADFDLNERDALNSIEDVQHVSDEDESQASASICGLESQQLERSFIVKQKLRDENPVKRTKSLQTAAPRFEREAGSHIDVIKPVKARVSACFLNDADTLSVAEKARALDSWTETQPKYRDSAKIVTDSPARIQGVRAFHFIETGSDSSISSSKFDIPSQLVRPSKDKVNASFVQESYGENHSAKSTMSVLEKARALQAYVEVQPKFRPGKETVRF